MDSGYLQRFLQAGLAFVLISATARAATLVVNSTADDGNGSCTADKCTLRDAILSSASGGTIKFSVAANSAITLTNGSLSIDKTLVITGPGPKLLTIQRSSAAGTADFRIIDIPAFGGEVSVSGLTISNGVDHSPNGGAAIHNADFLRLTNCTISGNTATQIGGGIGNIGVLVIDSSTIAANSAPAAGGIYNTGAGSVQLTNSTISGNSADRGSGGGILNFQGGALSVTNCTISGNKGAVGAGLYFFQTTGAMTISNSTISSNTVMDPNGRGGGLAVDNGAVIKIKSTVVAKNAAPNGPDFAVGNNDVTSQGYNLIGNNSGLPMAPAIGDQIGTPAAPIDPLLGPLQDNGGLTQTQALLPNSKAIDKGDPSGMPRDQRNLVRPVDTPSITNASEGTDVGAFEVQTDQLVGCSEINLVVNSDADSGAGSLRSIITSACGGSTITFAANVRGAIDLTSGELLLNKNLTIVGPGANLLSVRRSAAVGTTNFRIFNVPTKITVTISGLTIAKGNLPGGRGGGILNAGTLTLNNDTISDNIANSAGNGGGIWNDFGSLKINFCTLSGNSVSSTIGAGSGGAIFNQGGIVLIVGSTISGNSATDAAHEDSGGGIISNVGTVGIYDSTITHNTADFGGGVRSINGATVNLTNTIIALNTSPNGPDGNGPFMSLGAGFNLIGNGSGMTLANAGYDQIGTPAAPIDPLIGPLQDNGGPTFTRALLPGSPAIDRGQSVAASVLGLNSGSDQRGSLRPIDNAKIPNPIPGDGSDIGAFEIQATALANISTRLRVESGDNVLIGGFIVTGTKPKKVIVRAIGPSLPFADKLADPILELHDSAGIIETNDNWGDSPNKQATIDSTIPPGNPLESAVVRTLPANNASYTAVVRGVNGQTGTGVVEVYDLDVATDSRLANISTRGFVQTGDNVLIAGTIVVGPAPQKVIVRAIGPSLNLEGKLGDPTLQLVDGNGAQLAFNDNWRSDQEAEIIATSVPPTNDAEAAIVFTLPANGANYTAIVRGAGGATGIAVVEVYALN
jgi:CSLREA domain-containing protein